MTTTKLQAGERFPSMTVPASKGGEIELSTPKGKYDWRLVVVYRGKHCPICKRYLSTLNELLPELNDLGIDVAAVSADSLEKVEAQMAEVKPDFDVGYGLSVEQMRTLGLYISEPRSPAETDRPFAEPGLFVINADGNIQVIDISNAPFARPDLKSLSMGLKFTRNPENAYPIRGTLT